MPLPNIRKKNDEWYTPDYVVKLIVNDLLDNNIKKIFCPADKKDSAFVRVLSDFFEVGYSHIDNGFDFLDYDNDFFKDYDLILTNPPFSLKNEFIDKAIKIGKPWLFLLPISVFDSKKRFELLKNLDLSIFIFNHRINFNNSKNSPFASIFIGFGLKNSKPFNFLC